jgi:hypothetical protein
MPSCFTRRAVVRPLLLLVVCCSLAAGCSRRAASPEPVASREPGDWRLDLEVPGHSPSPAWTEDGRLAAAYVEDLADGPRVLFRRLAPSLEPPVTVSPPGLRVEAYGEVGPVLAFRPGHQAAVAYSVSVSGKWNSQLYAQLSTDDGRTWTAPTLLANDSRVGTHSFVDVQLNRDGQPVFSWLDNRDGHMGVRAAVLSSAHGVDANSTVDGVTCECCRPALFADSSGTLWLAYRDLLPGNVRDIALAQSRDGGRTFRPRGLVASDGWKLQGCPDSGPRLAETSDHRVWITWFTGGNTGIVFPLNFKGGDLNGWNARLDAGPFDGLRGYLSVGHVHAIYDPPFVGGLFLDSGALDSLTGGPFVIDHDQDLQEQLGIFWDIPRSGFWLGMTQRYDSGLVTDAGALEDVLSSPDTAYAAPFIRFNEDPQRIKPRTIFNFSLGARLQQYKIPFEIQLDILNAFDKKGLYNFQSVFGGTHVIPPRTIAGRIRYVF